MRLHTSSAGEVETAGLAETKDFSMKVTGKAFGILLDGLYADKVSAVIRELSTNAYDAHLAIGKGSTPFTIKIPSIYDPIFRVRDFGVSMNHEQTMRLMSTVFDSTKDTSNNQVGAFGLGSKSPFALVDSFTLTVWKDGEKRLYTCFKKPDGVPTIALMDTSKSSEPQGVEFTMTVNMRDIDSFKTKAKRILRWFPTAPKIEGPTIDLTPPKVLTSGNGWSLLENKSSYYGSGGGETFTAMARQGCVVYPIDGAPIPNMSEEFRSMLNSPFIIDFPIGTLDVAASREALSYDDETCKNIAARLNSVLKEITDNYGKAIKDAPTLWEAGTKLQELNGKSNLPHQLVHLLNKTKWQGKVDVGTSVHLSDLKDDLTKAGKAPTIYVWDRWRLRRNTASVPMDTNSMDDARRYAIPYGTDNVQFYFATTGAQPTYEARRIRADIASTHHDNKVGIYFLLADASHQQAVLDALGNPPATMCTWTKDLPEPQITPRASTKRGTTKKEEIKVREVEFSKSTASATLGTEKTIQLDGTDPHFLMTKNGAVYGVGRYDDSHDTISNTLYALSKLSEGGLLPKGPIYLISTTYEKRLETYGKWTNLRPVIQTKAAEIQKLLTEEAVGYALFNEVRDNVWIQCLRRNAKFLALATSGKTGALHTLHKAMETHGLDKASAPNGIKPPNRSSSQLWYATNFGIDTSAMNRLVEATVHKDAKLVALRDATKACQTAYPLVTSLENGNYYSVSQHILDYIEALDTLRAARAAAAAASLNPPAQIAPKANAPAPVTSLLVAAE